MNRRKVNRRRVSAGTRLKGGVFSIGRTLRKLFPYALAALILVAVPLGVFAGYRHVVSTDYFAIDDIQVVGASRVDAETLLNNLVLHRGLNIFDVDPERLETAALSDPWIVSAEVEVVLPRMVKVTIREREAALLVEINGQDWILDRAGKPVVVASNRDDNLDLPYLSGFESETAIPTARGLETLSLESLVKAQGWVASEYHYDPVLGFSVILEQGIEVRLGHDQFKERIARAKRVLDTRTDKIAYILVDHDLNAGRVVVGKEVANYHGR